MEDKYMDADFISPYTVEGRGALKLAGLSLDKDKHAYCLNGKKLQGITSLISKRLKKNFNGDFVEEGRGQGSHIHGAIEEYLRTGKLVSVHPAVRWAVEQLKGFEEEGHTLFSEVLVTDGKKYASAIDVLDVTSRGGLYIFDTKAGNFMRDYVSWQLGVYKYLLETTLHKSVRSCFCLSTKDRDIYPIIPRGEKDVRVLLYGK
jgi:hypothetical protein